MLEGRVWFGRPGAAETLLDELRQAAPVELPAAYYKLLSFSDGGEGPLPVCPYCLCLDASSEVIEALRTNNFGRRDLDGFVVFGSNGGGEYLVFDIRADAPWPIVIIDMVAGPGSAEQVATDFEVFLALIGKEADAL